MRLSEETHLGTCPLEARVLEDRGHLVPVRIDHVLAESRDELVDDLCGLTPLLGVGLASGSIRGRDESLRKRRWGIITTAARDEHDRRQRPKKSDGEAHPMDPMRCSRHVQVDEWNPWPWLAIGIVLLVSGCVWFAMANRRR
jgi:hypothetical protein